MDEKAYQRWWQLHLRVAKGEKLSRLEQMEYDRGLQIFDSAEKEQIEPVTAAALRQLRAQIAQLQTENAQLQAGSARLDRRIRALEKAYMKQVGYELASSAYATS
jgi:hypothetical protein